MKLLFKDTNDLHQFITVSIDNQLRVTKPYIKQAEKHIREITGDMLFDKLLDYVHQDTENIVLEKLLPNVQLPLAYFSFWLGLDFLNVHIGNTGITVASTESLVPASEKRTENLRESLHLSALDGLEELIKFLEENATDYPEWTTSAAYSFNRRFFINNANDFYLATNKKISRLDFLKYREYISLTESVIKGTISSELFLELKSQIKTNSVSETNKKLLGYITPVVGFSVLAKKTEKEIYQLEATRLMEELQQFLQKNATNYPLYMNSNNYSPKDTTLNSKESGLYAFGL